MALFKALGNTFQGVNSIVEGVKKRRDGKKFIAMSEAADRNFEQQDLINNAANIKVSGEGTRQALENINLNASQAFSDAANAGIRGVGMIGKIQQNVNQAVQVQAQKLEDREFGVQQQKAAEQSRIQGIQENRDIAERTRIDSELERGQALRSQGAAEIGQGASITGGGIDNTLSGAAKAVGSGGLSLFSGGVEEPPADIDGSPSLSNTPFNRFEDMFTARRARRNR